MGSRIKRVALGSHASRKLDRAEQAAAHALQWHATLVRCNLGDVNLRRRESGRQHT